MADENINPSGNASQEGVDLSAFTLDSGANNQPGSGNSVPVPGQGEGGSSNSNQTDHEFERVKKNPVELAKLYQSRLDKSIAELNKLKPNLATFEQHSQFLEKLATDRELRLAFINQYEPDLLKKDVDVEKYVETKLAEEFKDFEYDPNEAIKKPWSKHAEYLKRANALTAEATKNEYAEVGTLKELRQRLSDKAEKEKEDNLKTYNDIKTKFSVTDEVMTGFQKWGQLITPEAMFQIYLFSIRNARGKTPSVSNVHGSVIQDTNEHREKVRRVFLGQ